MTVWRKTHCSAFGKTLMRSISPLTEAGVFSLKLDKDAALNDCLKTVYDGSGRLHTHRTGRQRDLKYCCIIRK